MAAMAAYVTTGPSRSTPCIVLRSHALARRCAALDAAGQFAALSGEERSGKIHRLRYDLHMHRILMAAGCLVAISSTLACRDDKRSPAGGTAASGSAPGPAPTAAGDGKPACALLTAAEIATVVGNPVKEGTQDGTFFCHYSSVDPPGYDPSQGKPPPPAFSAHTFYARDDKQFNCANVLPKKPGNPNGAVTPVAGLGDRAAWEWNPVGWDGSLTICKGKDVLQVSLSCDQCKDAKQDEHRPKLEALAKTMLGRL